MTCEIIKAIRGSASTYLKAIVIARAAPEPGITGAFASFICICLGCTALRCYTSFSICKLTSLPAHAARGISLESIQASLDFCSMLLKRSLLFPFAGTPKNFCDFHTFQGPPVSFQRSCAPRLFFLSLFCLYSLRGTFALPQLPHAGTPASSCVYP